MTKKQDDTALVQVLIDAAVKNGSNQVRLSPGAYRIGRALQISPTTQFIGGPNATLTVGDHLPK